MSLLNTFSAFKYVHSAVTFTENKLNTETETQPANICWTIVDSSCSVSDNSERLLSSIRYFHTQYLPLKFKTEREIPHVAQSRFVVRKSSQSRNLQSTTGQRASRFNCIEHRRNSWLNAPTDHALNSDLSSWCKKRVFGWNRFTLNPLTEKACIDTLQATGICRVITLQTEKNPSLF